MVLVFLMSLLLLPDSLGLGSNKSQSSLTLLISMGLFSFNGLWSRRSDLLSSPFSFLAAKFY